MIWERLRSIEGRFPDHRGPISSWVWATLPSSPRVKDRPRFCSQLVGGPTICRLGLPERAVAVEDRPVLAVFVGDEVVDS
jgi:hypothetical protein